MKQKVYRVIIPVRPQFADTNSSHVHAGHEKPWPTVRELLSRPDYDSIHKTSNITLSHNGRGNQTVEGESVSRRAAEPLRMHPNTKQSIIRALHRAGGHSSSARGATGIPNHNTPEVFKPASEIGQEIKADAEQGVIRASHGTGVVFQIWIRQFLS